MELIKANRLNLNNGSKDILINSDFRILEGQKIGLIGPNGVGKTTLIRLILGEVEADSGTFYKREKLKVGYLPQVQDFCPEKSIEDFLLSDLESVINSIKLLEKKMSCISSDKMESVLNDYQKQCELFESGGGYIALEKGENLLKRLGLDNNIKQKMGTLSGGERSLVFFAKALLSEPELLILDEPGNHLDYLGLAWLEAFLNSYKGAVLIVSHNRSLLDNTCGHLMDMFNGKVNNFTGSYSDLRLEKYRSALVVQSEYEKSKKKIEVLTKKVKQLQSITTSQYNPPASIVAQLSDAKRKLKQEKDLDIQKPLLDDNSIKLNFGDENSKSHIALEIKEFSFGFDNNVLFENAKLNINCGEKVALVGPNGSGKSTLIKKIIESASWNSSNLRVGPSQKVGYLSQSPTFNSNSVTIEDEIRSWGSLTVDDAFAIAKKFSFTYRDMHKKLSVLSGGESNRIQLAKLMFDKTNFLILDEPTNHMDINSREVIEDAIKKFNGTVFVISHDRFFLDNLVNRVVEIENKILKSFDGNFTEYFKNKYPILPRLSGEVKSRGSQRKESVKNKNLTVVQIETRIEKDENEKTELESELKKCFEHGLTSKGKKIAIKIDKLNSRLEKHYREWESIS